MRDTSQGGGQDSLDGRADGRGWAAATVRMGANQASFAASEALSGAPLSCALGVALGHPSAQVALWPYQSFFAEFVTGQIFTYAYTSASVFVSEAGSFAENMVPQFEAWMLHGHRRPAAAPQPVALAGPVRAQLKAWALNHTVPEEICEVMDSLMSPSIAQQQPQTPAPPVEEAFAWPGVLSLSVFAVSAKIWQKV